MSDRAAPPTQTNLKSWGSHSAPHQCRLHGFDLGRSHNNMSILLEKDFFFFKPCTEGSQYVLRIQQVITDILDYIQNVYTQASMEHYIMNNIFPKYMEQPCEYTNTFHRAQPDYIRCMECTYQNFLQVVIVTNDGYLHIMSKNGLVSHDLVELGIPSKVTRPNVSESVLTPPIQEHLQLEAEVDVWADEFSNLSFETMPLESDTHINDCTHVDQNTPIVFEEQPHVSPDTICGYQAHSAIPSAKKDISNRTCHQTAITKAKGKVKPKANTFPRPRKKHPMSMYQHTDTPHLDATASKDDVCHLQSDSVPLLLNRHWKEYRQKLHDTYAAHGYHSFDRIVEEKDTRLNILCNIHRVSSAGATLYELQARGYHSHE